MQGHGLDESIREVVDSHFEKLAQGAVGKYRVPPMTPPKCKEGQNWRCFLEEFTEMVKIIYLKPSHHFTYFKQVDERVSKT